VFVRLRNSAAVLAQKSEARARSLKEVNLATARRRLAISANWLSTA